MVETQYPVAGSFGIPPTDRGYSAPVIQGPKFVYPLGGYPPDSRSLSPPPFYFFDGDPRKSSAYTNKRWMTSTDLIHPEKQISTPADISLPDIGFCPNLIRFYLLSFLLPPPSNRLIFLTLQSCSKCFAWDPDQTLKLKRFLFFRFRFFPEWFLLSKFQHYILTF